MGVFIEDLKNEDKHLSINWWNWRPTIELIRQSSLIDEERLQLMSFTGGGLEITEEESRKLGSYFEEKILAKLESVDRIKYDMSITSEPDDGEFYRDDFTKNYSATYEWLKTFTKFLKECKGFTVN